MAARLPAEMMRLCLPWAATGRLVIQLDVLGNDVTVPWIQIQVTKDLNPRRYILDFIHRPVYLFPKTAWKLIGLIISSEIVIAQQISFHWFLDVIAIHIHPYTSFGIVGEPAIQAQTVESVQSPGSKNDTVFLHQSCYELTILHFGRTEWFKHYFLRWIYTNSRTLNNSNKTFNKDWSRICGRIYFLREISTSYLSVHAWIWICICMYTLWICNRCSHHGRYKDSGTSRRTLPLFLSQSCSGHVPLSLC